MAFVSLWSGRLGTPSCQTGSCSSAPSPQTIARRYPNAMGLPVFLWAVSPSGNPVSCVRTITIAPFSIGFMDQRDHPVQLLTTRGIRNAIFPGPRHRDGAQDSHVPRQRKVTSAAFAILKFIAIPYSVVGEQLILCDSSASTPYTPGSLGTDSSGNNWDEFKHDEPFRGCGLLSQHRLYPVCSYLVSAISHPYKGKPRQRPCTDFNTSRNPSANALLTAYTR